MKKGKEMQAENISNVLSAAYAQQQSGLLSAECIQGSRLDKGEIYFLAGQPIYARMGKLSGEEALNHLLAWRNIQFSFTIDAPRPPANLSSKVRASLNFIPPETQPALVSRLPGLAGNQQWSEQHLLNLTHRQRMIYFLIDGQRTVTDLSRCSGKTVMEVEDILRELQKQGMVDVFSRNRR